MKAVTKIVFLDDEGEKFFGEGPARILQGIARTGSLRSAAVSMNMAYTKALKILKKAEDTLGYPLTARSTGGKDGGGSRLTPEGQYWLERYEAYHNACAQSNEDLFRRFFPKTGCVIMASGMGERFGGNKLMADFDGEPLILRAIQATEGLFYKRAAVTRHPEVAKLCKEYGVEVILHDLPHRSDTIRLGLETLKDADGCMFLPGDQPLLRRETVEELVKNWTKEQDKILRPVCKGKPGSPAIFPRWAFQELGSLPEGKGGSHVMTKHPEEILTLEVSDVYELMDADTPQTLNILLERKKECEGI